MRSLRTGGISSIERHYAGRCAAGGCPGAGTPLAGGTTAPGERLFEVFLVKGGDPAAPSGTATLLRLHPSHEPYRGKRPPCG